MKKRTINIFRKYISKEKESEFRDEALKKLLPMIKDPYDKDLIRKASVPELKEGIRTGLKIGEGYIREWRKSFMKTGDKKTYKEYKMALKRHKDLTKVLKKFDKWKKPIIQKP